MKTANVYKRIAAAALAILTVGVSVPEVPGAADITEMFSEKASAVDGHVTFDESTGTLTLSGFITKSNFNTYKWFENVKIVVADDTCVLPEDYSEMFKCMKASNNNYKYSWSSLVSIDLSKANSIKVTNMNNMFASLSYLKELNLSLSSVLCKLKKDLQIHTG